MRTRDLQDRRANRLFASSRIRSYSPAILGLIACSMLLPACQRSLFAGEESRTPFDSYDRRRGQEASLYVWDPFKQRRPNLRQRLLPKN